MQKKAAKRAWYADEKNDLFKLAKEKLGDKIIESPLYSGKDISEEKLARVDFEKTGSGTTLLGGELKDKTIIRHILPDAFLAWQKLYENHDLWKKSGFEYVPIEPIQSFYLRNDNLVDVYSGVLDLSLDSWQKMTDDFSKELDEDKIKILSVLDRSAVKHGHTHDSNFCLRFFRDESGKVDFSKKPRIYLIDFDQSISVPKPSF